MIKEILTILRESPEPISRLYEALRLRVAGHKINTQQIYRLSTPHRSSINCKRTAAIRGACP